jgi:ankyrin repeat protein
MKLRSTLFSIVAACFCNFLMTGCATPVHPIHYAAETGDLAKVHAILDENPREIGARGSLAMTPLMLAALEGHTDVVKLLLDKGAPVNETNEYKVPPLFMAAGAGHIDIVKLLLDKGAKVNARTNHDNTPLEHAAQNGHADVAKLLIDSGAEIEAKDDMGVTPLFEAAEGGYDDIVTLLLDKGRQLTEEQTTAQHRSSPRQRPAKPRLSRC